jgi:hypothetical protein
VRMKRLLLALVITAISNSPQLSAQQGSKQLCDVPLVVTRFVPASGTVELVKDLAVKDLTVRVGSAQSAPERASVDGGPRRIALILDGSHRIPKDEWKLETEMAASLLGHARPQDRFAFLLVGSDVATDPLLSSNEVIEKLRALAHSRPSAADSSERLYDTLLAAANRLDPPEFGDAIFLFGHPEDSGSKTGPDQVEQLVLKNRLRFYAMSFTDPLRGKLPPGFDLNKPLPKNLMQEKADQISHATGYFFSFHSVEALNIRGQSQLLKGFLGDLYAGIAEPYRLSILNSTALDRTALEVIVTDAKDRGIRPGDVHFPHYVYACAQSASATAIPASK